MADTWLKISSRTLVSFSVEKRVFMSDQLRTRPALPKRKDESHNEFGKKQETQSPFFLSEKPAFPHDVVTPHSHVKGSLRRPVSFHRPSPPPQLKMHDMKARATGQVRFRSY